MFAEPLAVAHGYSEASNRVRDQLTQTINCVAIADAAPVEIAGLGGTTQHIVAIANSVVICQPMM